MSMAADFAYDQGLEDAAKLLDKGAQDWQRLLAIKEQEQDRAPMNMGLGVEAGQLRARMETCTNMARMVRGLKGTR